MTHLNLDRGPDPAPGERSNSDDDNDDVRLSRKLGADQAQVTDDSRGVDCTITDVLAKAAPRYGTDEELLRGPRFVSTAHDEYQCPICKLVVDQAVEAPSCYRVLFLRKLHLAVDAWRRHVPFV